MNSRRVGSARARTALAVVMAASAALAPVRAQEPEVEPALRAAVERFFAMQEQEDVQGYLALWSESAASPQRERMLNFVFSMGDDRFSDIRILRVTPQPGGARVRVSATRDRTERARSADAPPVTTRTRFAAALTYAREGGGWKLLREAPASDDLALALLDADSPEERAAMLEADRELAGPALLSAISSRGTEAAQQQDYRRARDVYARMLEVADYLGDREAQGQALQNLGNALYFLRDLPAALDAYNRRLALERGRGDDAGVAAALSGIAVTRYALAEYGAALTAYRQALAIQEVLGDADAVATTLISTGNVLYLQGDYAGAVRDYTRSRDVARSRLDTFGEARANEGLGRVLMAQGDYASALQAFSGVLDEGRARKDPNREGGALLNIGEAHFRLGNADEARAAFEASRARFTAVNDAPNAGRAWQAIGLLELSLGRFPQAEEGYRQGIAVCAEAKDVDCVAGSTVGLAFAQSAQEQFGTAAAAYRKGIGMFSEAGRREQAARAEVGLSAALLGNRELDAAVDAARRAQAAATDLDNDDVLWRARLAEARALRRLARPEAARAALAGAVAALERLVQAAGVRPSTVVARDSSAVFALQAILEAEAGDPAAAFEAAERTRVHELRVTLLRAERDITPGMTDAEREEERAAVSEVVSWHAQITRERGLPKPDPERIERLLEGLAAATEARMQQQERLYARLPDLRAWRGIMTPVSRPEIEEVLAAARSATLILTFVVDEHDLLVLWAEARPGGPAFFSRVVPLTRRRLAERVASVVTSANLKDAALWREASSALVSAVLPEPALEALARSTHTIVLPHEVLWRVPFEAVPLDGGYVADGTLISYAQSVTSLRRPPSPSPRPADAPWTAVAIAAPAVATSVQAFLAETMPGWRLRGRDEAERELARIRERLAQDALSVIAGEAATESAVRATLPDADAVHAAAPFRVNSAGPLFSPLLLAAEDAEAGNASDGTLDLEEVMKLRLRARAAVVSDPAALSMRGAADEAGTVYWAWRAAGVPALIVPRWNAGEAADALLAELHGRLAAGQPPAEAIGAARRAVRGDDAFAAPHHWAGWLVVGW